ncbi:MAG: hypothetical protein OEU50_00685 [Gammaproteobacteria bacterium]|nr:hypothetical protein [Gammaproteobacteria bacterium]
MKRLQIFFLMLALVPATRAAAEEWIGLDERQPVLLGIDLGEDEVEDSSQALLLGLPIGNRFGYYGYYSETQLSDQDQEFDNQALVSTIWLQLTQLIEIELQHFFEGKEGELEKQTLGMAMALEQDGWQFRLQLDDGETIFFTRNVDSDFFDNFVPDSFSTDVSGYGISLGWHGQPWYWQASYQRYDYEDDLSVLSQSRFANFVVKSSTLAHSSLLISQNASLLLGHADLDNDYSVQVFQDRSAIDDSIGETLVLSWQHWASQRFGYLLAAASTLPVDDSIGLTLGLRWAL